MTRNLYTKPLWVALAVMAAALVGLPTVLGAQEKPEPKPAPEASPRPEALRVYPAGWVTEVFQLKFAQPSDLVGVLRMFSGRADFERDLRVVMWSGPKEFAPAVKDIVARLDVAPASVPSIELTFYLLSGSKQAATAGALPSELDGVATQVKGIFGLPRLSLLETAVIRVRDGSEGRAEGVVPSLGDPSHAAMYRLDFGSASLTADERGKVVSLRRLALTLNVPLGERSPDGKLSDLTYRDSSLCTDAEVREGQKVVLGKASVDRSGDTLFLVVNAKVVD
jgi:hypothetical protein